MGKVGLLGKITVKVLLTTTSTDQMIMNASDNVGNYRNNPKFSDR